jgi:TolA-binding protein
MKSRRSSILFTLIVVFVLKANCYAVDIVNAVPTEICMSEDTASKILVELERCRITEQQISDYEQSLSNLNEQIQKQKEVIEQQKKALEEANRMLRDKDSLIERAEKSCPKPSFFGELFKGLGFLGVGVLIGILL